MQIQSDSISLQDQEAALVEAALPPDQKATQYQSLAEQWETAGRDKRAIECYQQAYDLLKPDSKAAEICADIQLSVANLWRGQGKHRDAIAAYQAAITHFDTANDGPNEASAGCWFAIGQLHESLCRPKRAVPAYQSAIDVLKQVNPEHAHIRPVQDALLNASNAR